MSQNSTSTVGGLLGVLVVAVFLLGCGTQDQHSSAIAAPQLVGVDEEELMKRIEASTEYAAFISMHDQVHDLVQAALNNSVTPAQLKSAYSQVSQDHFAPGHLSYLLFGSAAEADQFVRDTEEIRRAFYGSFPELLTIAGTLPSGSCSLSSGNLDTYFDNANSLTPYPGMLMATPGTPTCGSVGNQVRLLACAGLCGATTAGAGAVLCGWFCWCQFCSNNSVLGAAIC